MARGRHLSATRYRLRTHALSGDLQLAVCLVAVASCLVPTAVSSRVLVSSGRSMLALAPCGILNGRKYFTPANQSYYSHQPIKSVPNKLVIPPLSPGSLPPPLLHHKPCGAHSTPHDPQHSATPTSLARDLCTSTATAKASSALSAMATSPHARKRCPWPRSRRRTSSASPPDGPTPLLSAETERCLSGDGRSTSSSHYGSTASSA